MRKTPLYQGKEQPLKKQVAGAASAISRGSHQLRQPSAVAAIGCGSHQPRQPRPSRPRRRRPRRAIGCGSHQPRQPRPWQEGAGGASNGEPRTGRALAPKHGQQDAWGGTSSGVRPVDAAGGRGSGVDFDRRKDSAFSVPLDAADGFRKVRGSDSGGLSSGVRPVDVAGSGGRGGSAGLGIRSGLDSRYCHNSASLMVCSGGSCTPGAASSTGSVSTDSPITGDPTHSVLNTASLAGSVSTEFADNRRPHPLSPQYSLVDRFCAGRFCVDRLCRLREPLEPWQHSRSRNTASLAGSVSIA